MERQDQVSNVLSRLAGVPSRIARASAALTEAAKRPTTGDGEWSAGDILAHLRASNDIWSHRMHAILVRDNPPLPAYDERRWAGVAGYAQIDYASSLNIYTLQRAELVTMLRGIALDDWQRFGTHEVKGSMTLVDVVLSLVEHEEEHCAQLEAIR